MNPLLDLFARYERAFEIIAGIAITTIVLVVIGGGL